ncbi:hypothetical protein SAMN05216489_07277 [Streptomyces sp. 3213]|uniref:hypothetical protein n=1 Tax=Streptomyces sp. 3213.3 TaxID=1855348 RepID=UPI000898F684|nr:hypothetical protein [Streptomyces sp. 3213.3]SEE58868.1 hypothetical protein SAMN05216489_07277 [Streptomyces sp. 3213] [Streptomyces sp. 3213.3]
MPFPPPPRTLTGPRRRSLLASAAGAALLVGCSTDGDDTENTAGSPSAAERARARAASDSETLLQHYDAVLAAHPTLADRLNPLRAEVVRHATAFGGSGSTPSSTATAEPSASASASAVPATASDALAGLAAAERSLADKRAKALLDVPGELARLLASVAAAGAGHAYLLTEDAK